MADVIVHANRTCTKCGESKPIESYNRDKKGACGRSARCRDCTKTYKAWYRVAHRGTFLKGMADWRAKNIVSARASGQARAKAAYQARKPYMEEWRSNNQEAIKCHRRKTKAALRSTPKGKLDAMVSGGMRRSLAKGSKAGRSAFTLLDYNVLELQAHLEKQFLPGMNWLNHGVKGWHVDHIIPLAVHNYSKPDDPDFKRAWALSNLRPLWSGENCAKGARLSEPFQPSFIL